MKTPEELKRLKAEVEDLKGKLAELNEDELEQVVSGRDEHTIPLPEPGEFWESWNPAMDFIHDHEGKLVP